MPYSDLRGNCCDQIEWCRSSPESRYCDRNRNNLATQMPIAANSGVGMRCMKVTLLPFTRMIFRSFLRRHCWNRPGNMPMPIRTHASPTRHRNASVRDRRGCLAPWGVGREGPSIDHLRSFVSRWSGLLADIWCEYVHGNGSCEITAWNGRSEKQNRTPSQLCCSSILKRRFCFRPAVPSC